MARRGPQGTTRRRILEILRQRGSVTSAELADELHVSAVAVRQHLALLQQEGMVVPDGERRRVGRPSQLYRLTAAADRCFPHTYERLALDLLICIGQQSREDVDQLFSARQQLLASRYAPHLAGLSLDDRVVELARILTEQGYMAETCFQDDGSLELIQRNCPIVQVASDYHQACACERALYEQLLEAQVISESTIAAGARCCKYRITP